MTDTDGVLGQRLSALVESGAHHFDPVRYRYIAAMARRCCGKPASVVRWVEQKALKALDDYCSRYEKAQHEAQVLVDHICAQHPDSADHARRLLDDGKFRRIRRLQQYLNEAAGTPSLTSLTDHLMEGGGDTPVAVPQSFDELLRRQEKEVVQSYDDAMVGGGELANHNNKMLRSFHLFKEAWGRQHADLLVTQAIQDLPEDPGPLNGQTLVTRSLSTMRALSPGYLSRFTSYIDTLLWLQQANKGGGSS